MAKKKAKSKPKIKVKSKRTAVVRNLSPKGDKKIALDFAQAVHEKFDRLIKASILFGSQARDSSGAKSDIDIIFVIDDASIEWDLELIAWYREELGKIIKNHANKLDREFHINTIKLTTWWLDLMHGDPVILNILRYGEALIDSGGFFNPVKRLLIDGKIRSTPEAAYAALNRSPAHLARSKLSELGAIEGVYWAMIDAAQAALITAGKVPPSPENIPALMKETFVEKGMLKMNAVSALRDIYSLHKGIEHKEVFDIKGIDIDKWQETAEKFISEMTGLIDKILEEQRN